MTVQKVYTTDIPNADDACQINLTLPATGQDDIKIPLGCAFTHTSDDNPNELPNFVSVKPLVFSEPTLNLQKASSPEFIPMDKDKMTFAEDDPIGFYYIFVNGHLWREMATLDKGFLHEIDLSLHHDKNHRPYSAKAAMEILLPIKNMGLLTDSDALSETQVDIAFSRVQWSWQYINALGGMWPSDARFEKSPQLTKCDDIDKAAQYRQARMQQLDLSQAPNWQSIENMGQLNGAACVYLHDMLGLAQQAKLNADFALALLKENQAFLEKNDFYQSAMMAHQLYLADELWETELVTTPSGSYVAQQQVYTKRDHQSRTARGVGKELSRETLEKFLVGDATKVLTYLDDYILAREQLTDLFYLDNSQIEQTLFEICQASNIQNPPEWQATVKDLSTLSAMHYRTAFECIYEQLLTLLVPATAIPCFIPAINQMAEKKRISKALKVRIEDDLQLVKSLVTNQSDWLAVQFNPPKDLFGDDLNLNQPNEDTLSEELGAFDPNKLKKDQIKIDYQTSGLIPPLVLLNNSSQFSHKGLTEYLSFKERIFKQQLLNQIAEVHEYQMIGNLVKSFDIDTFKNITIAELSNIPSDRVAVGLNMVQSPLFERNLGRKANKAIKNALASLEAGRRVNPNQIITIARSLSMKINPSGVSNQITDNMGNWVATQTQEQIEQMLKHVLSSKQALDDFKRMGVKVLTVPKTSLPANVVRQYHNEIDPGLHNNGLNLSGLKQFTFEAGRLLTCGLLLLSGIQAYKTYNNYEKEVGGKNKGYQIAKNIAVIGGTLAALGSVWEVYFLKDAEKYALTKAKLDDLAKDYTTKLKRVVKFTLLRTFGGLVGIVAGSVQIADAVELWQSADKDAAVATIIAAGLSIGSAFYGAVFVSLGPIGWALFIGAIIASIVAASLTDTKAEVWAKWGPFAKEKRGVFANEKGADYNSFSNAKTYYHALLSILFSPEVHVSKKGQNRYLIGVSLKLFNNIESELELTFNYRYLHPITLDIYSTQWAMQTKEYKTRFNDANQLVHAEYYLDLGSEQVIDTEEPIIKLRYNKELTLPLDFDALKQPLPNL
ncbi:sulfite exporter TauE/SafE family protein [Catenovulum sp. SM1970]|uniref:sulfite exporter TauE/SafE family protein n=1 Tax=Marinifaba aquimaris TaxID=2741323 RepID=UPI00157240C2|nr:sulfite exporter TauE/SafE family protein [Marinifaba aquimaris]NTS77919.1 sulfite exporter TauE/SafE family protein [Marinifaba aquimaris]